MTYIDFAGFFELADDLCDNAVRAGYAEGFVEWDPEMGPVVGALGSDDADA